ncbi:MAG TPA: sialate O-acetylesterase, partial [Pirellulaceae bacterium]|nr:sialate O-acetylesterase [Pirellulaceae bacterium]
MKSNQYCPRWSANLCLTLVASLAAVGNIDADVKVPNIFGSHMVLQQGQANPVWGWADPGEQVTVMIGDQTHSTQAGDDGRWQVKLASLPVGGPHELSVKGKNELKFADVLVGEVWVCSGQSNMQWSVAQSDDADLEKLTAKNSMIRLVTVPQVGTQEPQDHFDGAWAVCSSDNVGDFSAVGYFFGRQLQETLGVPIGLIDNAWGGSACEAWVSRDRLAADDRYKPLLDRWAATEASYDHEQEMAAYQAKRKEWEEGGKKGNAPSAPRNPLTGQHRPANLYNGV